MTGNMIKAGVSSNDSIESRVFTFVWTRMRRDDMRVPPAADRSIAPRMRPSWAVCVSLTQSTMRCGPCAWPRGLSLRFRHHVRICTWMRQRTASHVVCTPTSNRRLTASGCAWCFVSCLLMLHFPRSCRATRDTAPMVPGLAALR